MIEMTWVYFIFAIAVTAFVSSFVSFWIGRDQGERHAFRTHWDEQTERMERTQRLLAENHRLRRTVENLAAQGFYPENVWNNERSVPDQPR